MANIRNLKKDLNWLTQEVITDCLVYLDVNPTQDETPVAEIINTMISKHQELITRINKPTSGIDSKEVKKMYNEIVKDLFEISNGSFEKLSKLSRK